MNEGASGVDEGAGKDENAITSPRQKTSSAARAALERRVTHLIGGSLERASWESCRRAGSYLGLAFFAGGRKRRELAIANVQLALGFNRARARHVARRSAQNWGMTTCEFLHLPAASPQEIRDYVRLDGFEYLQSALQAGPGAILMMPHLGNWEVLAARLALEVPVSAIARPLSNAAAQARMMSVRRAAGLDVISKFAGGRPALKALRRGDVLCILPDRHAGAVGELLPFFNRATRFETSPARFAVMSGAPIVPACGVRRAPWLADGRIEARLFPAFSVSAASRNQRDAAITQGTRQVIASLETMIRAHPEQWSWMLRRWRDDDISIDD